MHACITISGLGICCSQVHGLLQPRYHASLQSRAAHITCIAGVDTQKIPCMGANADGMWLAAQNVLHKRVSCIIANKVGLCGLQCRMCCTKRAMHHCNQRWVMWLAVQGLLQQTYSAYKDGICGFRRRDGCTTTDSRYHASGGSTHPRKRWLAMHGIAANKGTMHQCKHRWFMWLAIQCRDYCTQGTMHQCKMRMACMTCSAEICYKQGYHAHGGSRAGIASLKAPPLGGRAAATPQLPGQQLAGSFLYGLRQDLLQHGQGPVLARAVPGKPRCLHGQTQAC